MKKERVTLGEIIAPRREKGLPAENPELPFIGLEHVEAHTMRILGSVPAETMRSNANRFYAGDVLYGRLRPYLNKVCSPSFDGHCSAEFIVFPKTEGLSPAFLKYRLNAKDFVSFATHQNTGDRPRVDFDQLSSFSFLLPSSLTQRRIVAKIEELLSELDKGVESLKTAREQLKVYRQAVLKHAFEGKLTARWREEHKDKLESPEQLLAGIQAGREACYQEQLKEWKDALAIWQASASKGRRPAKPARLAPLRLCRDPDLPVLPEGWGWVEYGGLCSLVRNGISERPSGTSGARIFRISAVRPMEFVLDDVRFIDNSDGRYDDYFLRPGDLVFTRYNGSRAYVGVCAEYRGEGSHLFPDKLIQTRLAVGSVSPPYIEGAVSCGASRNFIEKRIRTTAGQSGVSGSDIKAIPVPICRPDEQRIIVQRLSDEMVRVVRMLTEIEDALGRAETLRQSILKRAFSGKLVPQDPNDEPASVLLERIRTEKTAQGNKPRRQRTSLRA